MGKNAIGHSKTNPICRKGEIDAKCVFTKDYEENADNGFEKQSQNKPNSNPISERPKMSANLYVIEDYENETAFRLQKNKPKQSQSLVKDLIALVKKSCAHLWALLQCFSENFDKPGERKAECSARPKLRTDPMNLLGIMPAKEGKIDLKHSFLSAVADSGSAFVLLSQKICEIRG